MSKLPRYPTRSYPYRDRGTGVDPDDAAFEQADAPGKPELRARVLGLDGPAGRAMVPGELERLRDPLAELLLKRQTFPSTLQELLTFLNAFNQDADGLPVQQSFIVSEWGQIPLDPTTANYVRQLRYVITRGRPNNGRVRTVCQYRTTIRLPGPVPSGRSLGSGP